MGCRQSGDGASLLRSQLTEAQEDVEAARQLEQQAHASRERLQRELEAAQKALEDQVHWEHMH